MGQNSDRIHGHIANMKDYLEKLFPKLYDHTKVRQAHIEVRKTQKAYLRKGDWRCCGETQFGRRTMCRKCGVFKTIT